LISRIAAAPQRPARHPPAKGRHLRPLALRYREFHHAPAPTRDGHYADNSICGSAPPDHNGPVFDFGIRGYQPRWLCGLEPVAAAHGDRLAELADRMLTHVWVLWDHGTDTWFADAPVLLDFDGEQVEINHQNLDALSVTWDTVNTAEPVRWPVEGFDLRWREDPRGELADLRGQRVQSVELLEWNGPDLARGVVAVGFTLIGQQLTVYNALDENGLAISPPDPRYTHHTVGRP
jgi:hypothetical protein